MAVKSNYELTVDENTFCHQCGLPVDILKPVSLSKYLPAFYICFSCGTVGEIGVAPVPRA